jgi:hypothetical protein
MIDKRRRTVVSTSSESGKRNEAYESFSAADSSRLRRR